MVPYLNSSLISAPPPTSTPPCSYQGNTSSLPGTFWLWVSLSGRQALSVDFSPLILSHKSILPSRGHCCSVSIAPLAVHSFLPTVYSSNGYRVPGMCWGPGTDAWMGEAVQPHGWNVESEDSGAGLLGSNLASSPINWVSQCKLTNLSGPHFLLKN